MTLKLDHLAVAGRSLPEAETLVETTLGQQAAGHGQHAHFATHNALWGLGAAFYLEAIAIDPNGRPPSYPRWFGLDHFKGPARLSTWILATDDLPGTLDLLGDDYGLPVALQRGDYRWSISVPKSGQNGFDGVAPSIIQWHGDLHPAANLADCGYRWETLTVSHPKIDLLAAKLYPLLVDTSIKFATGEAGLVASFEGPNGKCVLT